MWEIIGEAKDVVGLITGGISLFQTGKSAFGSMSVFTGSIKTNNKSFRKNIISSRAIELGRKVDPIADKSFFMHEKEIYKKSEAGLFVPAKDKIIRPVKEEIDEIAKLHSQQDYAVEKVFSSVDDLPKGFLPAFLADPDDFISYKQMIGKGMPPLEYLRDPTLIPIEFIRDGNPMIGFIKRGYVEQVLHVSIQAAISNFTLRNLGKNPFEGKKIAFGDYCYCGSMKKFWTCHGSIEKIGGTSGKITMKGWGRS